MTDLTVSHTSSVTPDQIDHLGHMNVRFYHLNARAGTREMLRRLGIADPAAAPVVDIYTRHHHEQMEGNNLEVRSGVVGLADGHIRLFHELRNADDNDLAATFIHKVRYSGAVNETGPVVDVPDYGATRSIDLTTDPVASAPRLETIRELGLAIRKDRVVTSEECEDGDRVTPHMVTSLIWGGEPASGGEMQFHHEGPNGEKMGWATMETRVGVQQYPAKGTHIQSFSAVIGIANKTTQHIMWCFDLDTEELIVSFEVVNLAFDIGARRAMPIPDDMRAQEQARYHPELAPA